MHAIYTNMIVNGEVRDNGLNVQLHDHAHALVPMRTPSRKPRRAATQSRPCSRPRARAHAHALTQTMTRCCTLTPTR